MRWDLFAEKAVSLYCDETLWGKAQNRGDLIVRQLFYFDSNEDSLLQKVNVLASKLLESRKQNFIGQMLWHHQLRSTEFFSRWIETKNKLADYAKST